MTTISQISSTWNRINRPDSSTVERFEVSYSGDGRQVQCGICRASVNNSIVPHMKKCHPEVWEEWVVDFADRWNGGSSVKQIMKSYNTMFSWTVIENELRKLATVENSELRIRSKGKILQWRPSRRSFRLERSSIWSFRKRGDWAVHTSDYRGNWPPQVPRNLILKYTRRHETVLDPFVGGGTTLVECYLEGRNAIGVDINPFAIRMTRQRIKEMEEASSLNPSYDLPKTQMDVRLGDARDLSFINDESIDLICAHPPYAHTLRYTYSQKEDLSLIDDYNQFCVEMGRVALELFRVLRRGRTRPRKCAVLIGDVRMNGKFFALEDDLLHCFERAGFVLEERIIKQQHHDRSTAFYLSSMGKSKRHWLAHEYLLIFGKPVLKREISISLKNETSVLAARSFSA